MTGVSQPDDTSLKRVHDRKPGQASTDLTVAHLWAALRLGLADFLAKPQYGLFFGSLFAASGLALTYLLLARGEVSWLIPAAAGFPLLAPFTAVGLYEVSRRSELGLPIGWTAVLTAIRTRNDDQILSMGVLIFVGFGFWVIIAHLIFSIFLVEAGAGSESLAFLLTPSGLTMLAVGSAFGAVIAFVFFATTVFSLPMLVERDVDVLTAIFTSLAVVRDNLAVLLLWAFVIGALLFVAMVPAFLGLLVILPVLGHATWHLYRAAVPPAAH
ncbi:DUF2189 domain-containing protein [Erythrobacter sp. SCSIO 43205]|uniref:DUF2189 domain-containing protein n=1 Tax=Erythrobacter sp. SCSIO 43205 TaxID=2779361 RepID=UPI001CA8B3C8|nr:DUF2189 domain-containing protein [Erythrobacter sp. SCSIO 43205]UAB78907.1 DUF2189 domain-containing protein [Erythrobacter sp. SCSIO 43205]